MAKLKSFLISAGNSSVGAIGFCARVKARSKKEAIEIAKEQLPDCLEDLHKEFDLDDEIEYFNVYVNTDALTVKDIEDGETEDADEEDED